MATSLRYHDILCTGTATASPSHRTSGEALPQGPVRSSESITDTDIRGSRSEHQCPTGANPSPLLRINEDVFALVVAELLRSGGGSLSSLSLCCRQVRYHSMPALFSRCAIRNWSTHVTGIPPSSIRPFVRHLTYNWSLFQSQYHERCRPEVVVGLTTTLLHFPHVRSVTFDSTARGVQWEGMKICLSFPQLKSISFTGSATFTYMAPFPEDASTYCSSLEELRYPTRIGPVLAPGMWQVTTSANKRALERGCLSALLLGMHQRARSLVLPINTAPLEAMATVDWPALQDLFLGGSFHFTMDSSYPAHMRSMWLRMPNLRHLVLAAALPVLTVFRCQLLDCDVPLSTEPQSLQSLVIAYPDPSDTFFSIPFPRLSHLSLRDWPRHYDILTEEEYRGRWESPILSATEALSILRRVHAPGLTTLELVYSTDEADNELILFIAQSFPKLRHLELHRYRGSPEEIVDHQRIARALSVICTLVTLRLNLDFKEDPGKPDYIVFVEDFDPWRLQLANFGWDILDSLDACPLLEGVALLYHSTPQSLWLWLLRSRRDSRAAICKASKENCDILPSSLPPQIASKLMCY